jgi:YHS domain-containing protein
MTMRIQILMIAMAGMVAGQAGGQSPTSGPAAASKVRPARLELKPPGDPIYLVDEMEAQDEDWRTYRRPKVAMVSRDGGGIAVQGYDAVSYEDGTAVKGNAEFTAEYGEATWWFVSAEHRDRFLADPRRFVPAYGGFCAYSIGAGYPATANPKVFAEHGGRLYFFYDKAARAVWEQDQLRLIKKADANWPKLHR